MECEDEVIELRFELERSKDKEMKYLAMLQDIDNSLSVLFRREKENERFNLGEQTDYKECCKNLKEYLDECKRVYKIRL
jgi:hypothetical protein